MVQLPFNLVDGLFVLVLGAGVVHGRKHGLSKEFLSVLKWLLLLFGCALVYEPGGNALAQTGIDALSAFVMAYLTGGILIFLLFSFIERRFGRRIADSDAFGRTEYYLGMGSGMVRYACVVLMLLALLNARAFTPAEIKATERRQEESFGSTVFPGLHNLQVAVFERSFTGSCIRQNLGFLLIKPTEGGYYRVAPQQNEASRQ